MTPRQRRLGQDDREQSGSEAATGRRWRREADEQWAGRLRLRLDLRHDPPEGLADQVLDEVHEAVDDSGRSAYELFGDADDFAGQVAAERIDDAHRSRRDTHGSTPGEGFRGGLLVLGVIGVVLSLRGWFVSGLEFTVGWPALAATVLVGTVAILTVGALALRTAGRPRGMWTALAGAVVLVPVAGLAVGSLPGGSLFAVPAPLVLALAALPAVIGWLLPEERVSRWFNGSEAAHQNDDEAWLRRLEGVLRGAHGMPVAAARAHVEEVRAQLTTAGGTAHERFGPPRVYAQRLAVGSGARRRAARRKLRSDVLFAPFVIFALSEVFDDPDPGYVSTWVLPATVLLWAGLLWIRHRDARSS